MNCQPQIMDTSPTETFSRGFTLIEILVGVILVGIIGAMIASATKQGILTSQAILQQGEQNARATVLRRILHRDIHGMLWKSDLVPTSQGFALKSGHNLLLESSLPAVVTWTFNAQEVVRREEIPALDYVLEQKLIPNITSYELAMMSARDRQWVNHESWIMNPQQPTVVALRLRLQVTGRNSWEIIESLPQ